MRAPAAGGKSFKDTRSPVNIAGAELDELIRGVFRLSPPDQDPDCQVSQRKSTGQGTTTGGRAEHQSGTQPNGTSSYDSNTVQGRDRVHLTPASLRTAKLLI